MQSSNQPAFDSTANAAHSESSHISRKKSRRRRVLFICLAALSMLAVLIWLLPAMVAHSFLSAWLPALAAKGLNGSISLEAASLGWFSPVVFKGVEVKDAAGKTVLSLPSVRSRHSLLRLLLSWPNLGHISLQSPKLFLILNDHGSNVEELLTNYLAPAGKPSQAVGLELEIRDGMATVSDASAGGSWNIERLEGKFIMSADAEAQRELQLSASLPDASHSGRFDVRLFLAQAAGEAVLTIENLPLAMLRPLTARLTPVTELSGRGSGGLAAGWNQQNAAKNHLQAECELAGFSLLAPALQDERFRLEQLKLTAEGDVADGGFVLKKADVNCDFGAASFTGEAPLKSIRRWEEFTEIASRNQKLTASVDLARLASRLSGALHLRQEVRFDSGQLQLTAESRSEPSGAQWRAKLQTGNLAAVADGRQFFWREPLTAILEAHQTPTGTIIDMFRCEADFLKLRAGGSSEELAASLEFDLRLIAERLKQFFALGDIQLRGAGNGRLAWKRRPKNGFQLEAELNAGDVRFQSASDAPAWDEEKIFIALSTLGEHAPDETIRLDAASVKLIAGTDQLEAKLSKPVVLQSNVEWPISLNMQGDLTAWSKRLGPWAPRTTDRLLSGRYTLQAVATASKQKLAWREARLTAASLKIAAPWLALNEPHVELLCTGSYETSRRRLQLNVGNLSCETLAGTVENLMLSWPKDSPMELAGGMKCQADLGRLSGWFHADATKPPTWQPAGRLGGTAQFRYSAGALHTEVLADAERVEVRDAAGRRLVQEPLVRLSVRMVLEKDKKLLRFTEAGAGSSSISCGSLGQISWSSGGMEAAFDAQLRYDMRRLCEVLRPYIGAGLNAEGEGVATASFRGPFTLAAAKGELAGLKWNTIGAYGFRGGPAEIKAALNKGDIRLEPIMVAANGGWVFLAPLLRLQTTPAVCILPAGPLAEQIIVDQALCASWLKYVAPVLAEATSVEGKFSLSLDGCRIPLSAPEKSDISGRLLVHSIEIGPGPLIRELAVVLGRESPAKLKRESVVPFRMVNGRVYHQNLELLFPDFWVRTNGSVGLDQTLDVLVEMPIPPKWLAANPVLAQAFRGQLVRLPLKGTLGKPVLDRQALESISRELLRKAAGNILEEELNKQLDRLLNPKK